jgi:hypothetical protein
MSYFIYLIKMFLLTSNVINIESIAKIKMKIKNTKLIII